MTACTGQIREIPIPFSAPMVRAILDGRKTQTRRALKPQPRFNSVAGFVCVGTEVQTGHGLWQSNDCHGKPLAAFTGGPGCITSTIKARWAVGDRLWVRETWNFNPDHPSTPEFACFRADLGHDYDIPKWRPSIHMPRKASRITLEVEAVRIERLQDISEEDAIAEGAFKGEVTGRVFNSVREMRLGGPQWRSARDWYADLWDHISGAGAWGANPWVSVTTFRRIA